MTSPEVVIEPPVHDILVVIVSISIFELFQIILAIPKVTKLLAVTVIVLSERLVL